MIKLGQYRLADQRGKVRLSMKAVDQATGEDLEGKKGEREPQHAEGAAE